MDKVFHQASPILVIGMHRSGTRLLAQVLEQLGVFMGADQQGDSESVTFLTLNETILHQCGAFWSEPMSAHFLLSQPESANQLAEIMMETLPQHLPRYLGAEGTDGNLSLPDLFGWKDPRNTFTLPVWRQIFPQLRVIHVIRHGIDVAASLARRHKQALVEATGTAHPPALTVIRDNALGVLSSRRGWIVLEALAMWEQYVEKARSEAQELGDRALEVRFEDLLSEPVSTISQISAFCGVPDASAIPQQIVKGRAFAFRADSELTTIAQMAGDPLKRFGYAP
jgi:hypothetical protein